MVRTKKFNGQTYQLVSNPKTISFTKTEKEKKVKELKQKGFSVRTIDVSGYPDRKRAYTIWKK